MTEPSREQRLNQAFVTLADTLVAGYDLVDLLHYLVDTSVELLDASAAGIVLADRWHRLDVLAATNEDSELLEVLQLQAGNGPSMDCFSAGVAQSIPDLALMEAEWPHFVPLALEQGVRSVHVVPMRLRDETIGALNVFRSRVGRLAERDGRTLQALADVATIGILQERAVRDNADVNDRLEDALNSRVVIEQAKGVLANYGQIGMDQAFNALRSYASSNGIPLTHLAQGLVDRRIRPAEILDKRRATAARPGRATPPVKRPRPAPGNA
jgi:GAF domain-containing protein